MVSIWDNQPLFRFEINYFHDCNKATSHKKEDRVPISFKKSFFYWQLENFDEEIISFDDDFLSRKFFYSDLKMFLTCCKAKYFDVELTLKSHFFLVNIEYEEHEKKDNLIWRFKRYAYIGSKKRIQLRLLAIILFSKSSYMSIIRMENTNPLADDKAGWLMYDPSKTPKLFDLSKKNIQDAFIEINENDYDYKVHPCLLLYENIHHN